MTVSSGRSRLAAAEIAQLVVEAGLTVDGVEAAPHASPDFADRVTVRVESEDVARSLSELDREFRRLLGAAEPGRVEAGLDGFVRELTVSREGGGTFQLKNFGILIQDVNGIFSIQEKSVPAVPAPGPPLSPEPVAAERTPNTSDDAARHERAATLLARIVSLSDQLATIKTELAETVLASREVGVTWREIGDASGTTPQAAYRKWDPRQSKGKRENSRD